MRWGVKGGREGKVGHAPTSRAQMKGGYPRGFWGKPEGIGELQEFTSHVWVTRTAVGKAVAVSGRKSMDGKEKVRTT